MSTHLPDSTTSGNSPSQSLQPQDFEDIRHSIERIEELLQHGQILLYGDEEEDYNPSSSNNNNNNNNNNSENSIENKVRGMSRENNGELSPIPRYEEVWGEKKKKPYMNSDSRLNGDNKNNHNHQNNNNNNKYQKENTLNSTLLRETSKTKPKDGVVVQRPAPPKPTRSHAMHNRVEEQKKNKRNIIECESFKEDDIENVTIEELRQRVRRELEEYRRHGSVMSQEKKEKNSMKSPQQHIRRFNSQNPNTFFVDTNKSYQRATSYKDTLVRVDKEKKVAPVRHDINGKGFVLASFNKTLDYTNSANNKNNNHNNDIQNPSQRIPVWKRLYEDAARIQERRLQRQRALEQQREELTYKFKVNPYNSDSLKKRYSLKVTPSSSLIIGKGKSNDSSQSKGKTQSLIHALTLVNKRQKRLNRKEEKEHIPGSVFTRRVTKTKKEYPHVETEIKQISESEDTQMERLSKTNAAINFSSPPTIRKEEKEKEKNIIMDKKNNNNKTLSKGEKNQILNGVETHLENNNQTYHDSNNLSIHSSNSSVEWEVVSNASSSVTSTLPPWDTNSQLPMPSIPKFVKPLDLRALRK